MWQPRYVKDSIRIRVLLAYKFGRCRRTRLLICQMPILQKANAYPGSQLDHHVTMASVSNGQFSFGFATGRFSFGFATVARIQDGEIGQHAWRIIFNFFKQFLSSFFYLSLILAQIFNYLLILTHNLSFLSKRGYNFFQVVFYRSLILAQIFNYLLILTHFNPKKSPQYHSVVRKFTIHPDLQSRKFSSRSVSGCSLITAHQYLSGGCQTNSHLTIGIVRNHDKLPMAYRYRRQQQPHLLH